MKNEIDLDALLREMAAHHQPQLPSASLIWWRAQISRKLRAKERIERPLMAMRVAAAITCTVIMVTLIAGSWGQLQAEVRDNRWLLIPVLLLTATASLVSVALLVWSWVKGDRCPYSSSLDFNLIKFNSRETRKPPSRY